MEDLVLRGHTVVIITPNGTAKFEIETISRGMNASLLFADWRKKNKGEYIDIINKKFTEEEKNKFPVIVDQKEKIAELIERECELFVDGVMQDVEFLILKHWNQLNHK